MKYIIIGIIGIHLLLWCIAFGIYFFVKLKFKLKGIKQ